MDLGTLKTNKIAGSIWLRLNKGQDTLRCIESIRGQKYPYVINGGLVWSSFEKISWWCLINQFQTANIHGKWTQKVGEQMYILVQ